MAVLFQNSRFTVASFHFGRNLGLSIDKIHLSLQNLETENAELFNYLLPFNDILVNTALHRYQTCQNKPCRWLNRVPAK